MNGIPRFYPILDAAAAEHAGVDPLAAAGAILHAGAAILQWRSKAPLTQSHLDLVERLARTCLDHHATFVVNDRADVALLAGAGLHIGQDDLSPAHARSLLGPGAVLGYSTHNKTQLREAASSGVPFSYLALGPIFATGSKENPDPVVGLRQLREWRPLAVQPLVAIGGIARCNAGSVLDAGADSVAVISDLLPQPCTLSAIGHRVEEWLNLVA
jgi:thiamine-phosphate pyrophosphorylase